VFGAAISAIPALQPAAKRMPHSFAKACLRMAFFTFKIRLVLPFQAIYTILVETQNNYPIDKQLDCA
jgi:hypothetical protein